MNLSATEKRHFMQISSLPALIKRRVPISINGKKFGGAKVNNMLQIKKIILTGQGKG